MAESYIKKVSAGGGGRSKINYTNAGIQTAIANSNEVLPDTLSLLTIFGASSAAANSNYALFAGGSTGAVSIATVTAYNTSFSRFAAANLSSARQSMTPGTVGIYVLFAGGIATTTYVATVDAYDTSLTRTTPTGLPVASLSGFGNASTLNHALFAGGYNSSNGLFLSTVTTYNTSLSRSTASNLSTTTSSAHGNKIGDYALFAGGYTPTIPGYTTTVNAYNSSLTRSNPSSLSSTIGNVYVNTGQSGNSLYAFFTGNDVVSDIVNAYNSSLSRFVPTPLPIVGKITTTIRGTTSEIAMFAYNYDTSTNVLLKDMYVYNTSLSLLNGVTTEKTYNGVGPVVNFNNHVLASGSTAQGERDIFVFKYSSTTKYSLRTPTLSDFNITYSFNFNNIGTGTVGEGVTLSSSTTFTGFLEIPEEVT
jgi:hypothetical protein